MSGQPLLLIEDLVVNYGAINAVKGLSIEVCKGEIVSLVGGNGAGKSSTLRAISGIVASKGNIILDGRNVAKLEPHHRVQAGLVQSPEGRGIFASMTVYENLLVGAHTRKDSLEDSLKWCYELFPILVERTKQVAGTLSGGEQQMLAISRALMARPKILMLDEPSLGLAPKIVLQIFEIIKRLNTEGVTILLVEQNARMALKFSHRAYVMETGVKVIEGRGQELLADEKVKASYLGG
ncbi:MAG: ABC transporter ATP-binding protein [Bdellovibrionales bacterium RIFOXYD12_FULL_39_22]|nr:MAG: ABC transporter ATP-binding protein [Bdellovibrionales bacterium RIFOXYB1_FULL_39_21]OFZ41052.1 MAG: ABC transporter ATP-binding protein [Bdellovibrionales bacterium RIFOXYC12_FULL_39_17]OFZ50265.1 MAG: ABC transporter ATP-binding protein [Bdellovibrionales bacterium RIFOXYC1_FULL_39_130]OFZ73340.1 MAG: ABC transporter ATP-binding protein [Bdellovibrionales bacterium RIFOXYC2_FULL_39_8]OFZ75066.1 MAG: ABC transporter ATP-binding protein [Bdellovibrionales bacterium RIFOXYD1_FULL_39_84]